jgi:RNA polymerase sigma-70 factor (ECF subfamily)
MSLGPQFEPALSAAKDGDERGLAAIYRDLHPVLLGYLFAQEPAEAEDLASETWMDLGRGLERFEGDESAFRCWAFTICRRRLIDLRRARSRRRTDPVPTELIADRADPVDPYGSMEGSEAVACLAALPPEQAEIVLLRVIGGLDSYEVARVTGRKPGTVRVMQKRALERLAEILTADARGVVTR